MNNWKGVIDPLHPDLRAAGIRYGEFIEAVYDAIDMEEESEYIYYSLYGKSDLLPSVGVTSDYKITRYLYSTLVVEGWRTAFDGFHKRSSTSWIGYIAVSSDRETQNLGRRDVAVILRGTKASDEWYVNSEIMLKDLKLLGMDKPLPRVMAGFLSMYTASDASKMFGDASLRDQICKEVNRLVEVDYKDEDMSITFLGHSMGAGIAPLAAADYGFNKPRIAEGRTVMVTAFVYGAPKTGDREFKRRAEESCKIIRVVSTGDIVTLIPPASLTPPGIYHHVGVEWRVDWSSSPFVQDLGVGMRCHNLELYLHCIAGQKKSPIKADLSSNFTGAQERSLASVLEMKMEIPESFMELFKDEPETVHEFVSEHSAVYKTSRLIKQADPASSSNGARKRLRRDLESFVAMNGDESAAMMETTRSSAGFELVVPRDYALMNKSDDLVVKELKIPKSWWVHGFKSMRKLSAGKWIPRHRWPPREIPSEENPEFN